MYNKYMDKKISEKVIKVTIIQLKKKKHYIALLKNTMIMSLYGGLLLKLIIIKIINYV